MSSFQQGDGGPDHDSYRSGDESGDESGKGKGKGKDEKQKRGINRVNRACTLCRKQKMRCIGAEDPPCKRCRASGQECIMEKPGRPNDGAGDERIRSLETQVTSIQSTLSELVSTLRAGMSSNMSQGSNHTPHLPTTTTPDFPPPQNMTMAMFHNTSPSTYDGVQASVGGPTPPFFNNPSNTGAPFFSQASPNQARGFQYADGQWHGQGEGAGFNGSIDPTLTMAGEGRQPGSFQWQQPQQQQLHPPQQDQGGPGAQTTPFQSLPPSRHGSRGGSVTPDDILAPEEIINPLGAMSTMAGSLEAEMRKKKLDKATSDRKRPIEDDGFIQPGKKAREDPILPHGPTIQESQNLPPQSSKDRARKAAKKTHIHAYPDIVEEGFVSEAEGRELMNIFYAGSSNFAPCFDPATDTWENLRKRSPFSITAIIMVGARVRDGGGAISEVQRVAREHAQRIALGTMFNPVARVEAVQAMIQLAAFSENGWLPGGHAVRMAIDMGLNRSFLHLLRTGLGQGKSPAELEEERHLVVQSRIWFCLYLIEHQMAYGMGRPAILREDETIHQCRRLLEHPLSITSDARLVSTVELMALRAPLHIELTTSPDLPITENTMRRLKQANTDFDAWERYWDRVLGERFGKGRGDFFRESLIIQRQYAELFVNSQLLRGIKEPTDVVNMPDEKRALAIRAMRNAQRCIEICLRGENYRNGLRYAVHYTHVCAAFAASFLIRIARLFPHELNLKKTAKDVDELANVLAEVPAGRYARSLRLILRRARRAKVIPAASRATSPQRGVTGLPSMTPIKDAKDAFSPSQLINPHFLPTPTPGPTGHTPQAIAGTGHMTQGPAGAGAGAAAFSPSTLLAQAGQIINDSPSSGADLFEFDQLFAQETMERAGLAQNEGDQLPLFLDGQSLGPGPGNGPNFGELAPFMGMEQFFLPQAVDNRLGGQSVIDQNTMGMQGFDPNMLAEDLWW